MDAYQKRLGIVPATGEVVIDFDIEDLQRTFEEVTPAGVAETPWARESRIPIAVCRGLKRPIDEVWQEAKNFS